MLIDKGAMVNEKNNIGDTPMHCATLQGHFPIICVLASSGGQRCELGKLDPYSSKY